MNNPNVDKAFQKPDYTLYPKLFSAVKNIENSFRLLAYDNMKMLQLFNHFSTLPSLLSIIPLKNSLEESPPKTNLDFYTTIENQLSRYEACMKVLWKNEVLRESIMEIYFLIHQAKLSWI